MIVARTARTVLVRVVRTRCAVLRWYVCGVELVALGARSLGALLGERVVLVPVRTSTLFGARRTLSRRALRLLRRGARVLRCAVSGRSSSGVTRNATRQAQQARRTIQLAWCVRAASTGRVGIVARGAPRGVRVLHSLGARRRLSVCCSSGAWCCLLADNLIRVSL